jgi:hypothetical protein
MTIGVTNFPDELDDLTSLIRAVNRASSELTSPITAVDDSVTVADASWAPIDGLFWVDSEAITFEGKTGNTLFGCSRGANGTVASSHLAGADVYFDILAAAHHNVLAAAIVATQAKIGNGASLPTEGQYLKGTAILGESAWGGLTGAEIIAALGFTPGQMQVAPGTIKVASQVVASQASVSINSCFSDTYSNYRLVVDGLVMGTAAAQLWLRLRTGGADDSGTVYSWNATQWTEVAATIVNTTGPSQNKIFLAGAAGVITSGMVDVMIARPFKTTPTTVISTAQVAESNTLYDRFQAAGFHQSSTSMNGFSLVASAGTFSGTVRLYGLAD